MFQRVGAAAYRADLGNITELCNILDNPQQSLKCIHIAGTNGKGSVTHIIASVLQAQGYKVGVFVSPHYKDYRERIKINGQLISKPFVTKFVAENQERFKQVNASFFEISTAMAFAYFKAKKVDYAVIETGMGGAAGFYQYHYAHTIGYYQYKQRPRAVSGRYYSQDSRREGGHNKA